MAFLEILWSTETEDDFDGMDIHVLKNQTSRSLLHELFLKHTGGQFRADDATSLLQQVAGTQHGSAAHATRTVTGAAKFAPPIGTPPKVTLADEGFVVASTVTLAKQTGTTPDPVARGDAHAKMVDYLAANPTAEGTLQVIPAYELAA